MTFVPSYPRTIMPSCWLCLHYRCGDPFMDGKCGAGWCTKRVRRNPEADAVGCPLFASARDGETLPTPWWMYKPTPVFTTEERNTTREEAAVPEPTLPMVVPKAAPLPEKLRAVAAQALVLDRRINRRVLAELLLAAAERIDDLHAALDADDDERRTR